MLSGEQSEMSAVGRPVTRVALFVVVNFNDELWAAPSNETRSRSGIASERASASCLRVHACKVFARESRGHESLSVSAHGQQKRGSKRFRLKLLATNASPIA